MTQSSTRPPTLRRRPHPGLGRKGWVVHQVQTYRGGFNWSSQHLHGGGGQCGDRVGWSAKVTGRPSVRRPGGRGGEAGAAGGVLGPGRGWVLQRGGGRNGGCVVGARRANPFGGFSRGWDTVSQALDFASSKFRDGTPVRVEEVSRYTGPDLVSVIEHEHWENKVGRSRRDVAIRLTRHDHVSPGERCMRDRQSECRPTDDTASRRAHTPSS